MNAWLEQFSPVQRELLLIGGGLLVMVLLFVLLWIPLKDQRESLSARVVQQRITLNYVEAAVPGLRAPGNGPEQTAITDDRSLLALVDASVRANGLSEALSRAEPDGASRVRVWLDAAAFDAIAAWLESLYGTYGVEALELSVDRAGGPGQVNVRVVLSQA